MRGKSAYGPSRHFAAVLQQRRFWSKVDLTENPDLPSFEPTKSNRK
jgi:hypothetical protein